LIQVAAENSYVLEEDIEILKKWRLNPATWGDNFQ